VTNLGPYLVKRLLGALLTLLAMTFVTFVIFYVIPQNPARAVVPLQNPSNEQLERAREYLGVDQPLVVQWAKYVWRLAHGSFGLTFGRPGNRVEVTDVLLDAAPVTLSLVAGSAVLWVTFSLVFGTLTAQRPRSALDRAVLTVTIVAVSFHPVTIGLALRYLFGAELELAPFGGYCPLTSTTGPDGCGGPRDWASHLVLPWIAFALPFTALYTRMTRSMVSETLHERWVTTARAKGAPEARVLRSHVLRVSLLPIVTLLGLDLGLVIGTAAFTEIVFELPGLGRLAYISLRGTGEFDLPTLLGVVVFTTAFVVVANLLVDVIVPLLDPRVGRS
jgi:peptide/nickel transport system permease protein